MRDFLSPVDDARGVFPLHNVVVDARQAVIPGDDLSDETVPADHRGFGLGGGCHLLPFFGTWALFAKLRCYFPMQPGKHTAVLLLSDSELLNRVVHNSEHRLLSARY
jgi:hypothetical protein